MACNMPTILIHDLCVTEGPLDDLQAEQRDELASAIMGVCTQLLEADAKLHVALLGILPKGDYSPGGKPLYELPNR